MTHFNLKSVSVCLCPFPQLFLTISTYLSHRSVTYFCAILKIKSVEIKYIGSRKDPLKLIFNSQCPPPVQLLEIFLSVPVPFSPTFSYYFHVSLSPVGRLLLRHPQNRSNLSSSKSSQWKLSTLARGWRNWPRTSRACAGSAAAPASPLAVRRRSRRAAPPAYQCL